MHLFYTMAYLLFWILAFAAITVTASDNPLDMILPRQQNISSTWPCGPFSTRGRDIVNSRRRSNHMGGLQLAPQPRDHDPRRPGIHLCRFHPRPHRLRRLQLYSNVTLISALDPDNGALITSQILLHNPIWTRNTTLFKIWSDIVRVAARKNLYIHPDAHVSKAGWCCSQTDGNAWFGDEHFDIENWTRGLGYVARWAGDHTNIVSMSLRNELRESWGMARGGSGYNWVNFVGKMTAAAAGVIHAANEDLLILGGECSTGRICLR
ncbi:uncharacterized protein PODANS_5_6410 [Podospora anserina S mat+]|uniref:Glycoside Hydrolase Family 5 n=1 Tax=Podospora anserina (strain S / ATCC MYA-4624 / DSM 980 / FGSC 10383) TaxID=515849 RepID=B2AM64_PODAN|nr:uncharacterized protein PODANS_5_6410 [Podospora anserina S mat+]CAP65052.1 unnamed protein product [Podospora anserina S mat+]CDP29855.1 Putative Glycoside Hydrolase Family 5 [Podospora anserina S mat+]